VYRGRRKSLLHRSYILSASYRARKHVSGINREGAAREMPVESPSLWGESGSIRLYSPSFLPASSSFVVILPRARIIHGWEPIESPAVLLSQTLEKRVYRIGMYNCGLGDGEHPPHRGGLETAAYHVSSLSSREPGKAPDSRPPRTGNRQSSRSLVRAGPGRGERIFLLIDESQ